MKKMSIPATVVFLSLLLQSCLKDKLTHTYSIMEPVYKTKDEVYANIKSNPPQEIKSPGKIFVFGNYIFLNEKDKGVHVIDNSNPAKPILKTFIDIPGNLEIAVKGNTLYADLYSDLVVVDISNPLQAKFVKYLPNVFPERNYGSGFIADNTRIIVGWVKKDTTVNLIQPSRYYITYDAFLRYSATASIGGVSIPGLSGSMARFSIVNDYLYSVNRSTLGSFNISNAADPQRINNNNVGWNIETIYPFKDKLFIGSTSGMFIYDISNPASPNRVGQFTHATSCDPVIADDNNAYVTLHDGTQCGGTANVLDVLNVTNLSAPSLIKSYPMTHPHGLAKDNNLLFICDGRDGLKMYDATNLSSLVLKKHITGLETYDAIAWNTNLIVVAKDGLYQYDYSNPNDLVQRSKLTVNH
ncbi:MAG TPA: hypothetical protein VGQ09_07925 [Chitinophagaceae bacterium]|nr:hypothetical protein [Chitinophagaceae bacterium]